MAANNFDFGVIGAGIVGLAMANRIRQIHPNASIAVFDKENSVGEHASGRNSGVLHAGFYYSPDSLKAALTRVPLGRVLNPSEIAGLAVYLGSAESSGMTGQSIHVDGGMVLS